MAAPASQQATAAAAISCGEYGTAGFISLVGWEPTTATDMILFAMFIGIIAQAARATEPRASRGSACARGVSSVALGVRRRLGVGRVLGMQGMYGLQEVAQLVGQRDHDQHRGSQLGHLQAAGQQQGAGSAG